MKKLNIILAVTLFMILSVASFAQITSNELISRGKPAYSSNNDASRLVDNIFGYGVVNTNSGDWIAIEVGSGPSEIFFSWNNATYSWSDVIAAETSCKQSASIPVDYTLQVSSNSTDGSDGDWTIVESITENTVTSRGHRIPFNGASWVKIVIDNGTGSFDEVEVFDMSNGGTDTWFFPGTSISANIFKSAPESNFADVVSELYPGFSPVMIRGGIPCINSTSFANDIDLYIENARNVNFWAIEMGTNDAWGGSDYWVPTFTENMIVVIEACLENGIQPIIARMIGTNEEAAGWQIHPDYLTAIDSLTEAYGLFPGPDFYTWFSLHPEDLASDGVHPSESGNASAQRLWAESLAALYTGSVVPVESISVDPSSISLMVGSSASIAATVLPSNATYKQYTWSTSDAGIVEITNAGLITGVAEGTAQVIATTMDSGYEASATVTVVPDTVIDIYTLTISSSGSGSVQISPEGTEFEENTVVMLTAEVEEGAQFLGWSGDISGTSASITITMNSDKNITASFSTLLSCDSYESISLPYTQNGEGEYCMITSGTIDHINSWNLDYLEVNGVEFTNTWANNMPDRINGNYYIHCVSSVGWGHLEIEGSETSPESVELVVEQVSGGTIAPSGGKYEVDTEVTLTAIVDEDFIFINWTGDLSGSDNPITITMDVDKTISANFQRIGGVLVNLEVLIEGEGTVEPGSGVYELGETVTLVAIPDNGYVFAGWKGDLSGSESSVDLLLEIDKSVTAVFEPESVITYTLTTSTEGEGAGMIEPESGEYEASTSVALQVIVANDGSYFVEWAGDASGTDPTVTITMDSDKHVIGVFDRIELEPTLTVNISGEGSVSPGSGTYYYGDEVILTATPADGYLFSGWSGDASGTSTEVTIFMDADKSVTANFVPEGGSPCDYPVAISLPMSQNGVGEYCWFTTDDISYVNSWNMAGVNINGTDFTNAWSSSMPEKIDGGYYIEYHAEFAWSHFEAIALKSVGGSEPVSMVYPNPFSDKISILISDYENVVNMSVLDEIGRGVHVFEAEVISEEVILDKDLLPGTYYLRIVREQSIETIKIVKN